MRTNKEFIVFCAQPQFIDVVDSQKLHEYLGTDCTLDAPNEMLCEQQQAVAKDHIA
jgi:hypothetical protein